MKKLETIEDHEERVTKPRNFYAGIECPACKYELSYTDPDQVLLSDPPQQNVKCYNCGFHTTVKI